MTPSQWLDITVVIIAFIGAISGWRSGALGSILSFIGVALGAMAGVLLAPHLVSLVSGMRMKLFVALFLILCMVIIGEVAGVILGRIARESIHQSNLRFLDSVVGTALQLAIVFISAWFIAVPIASTGQFGLTEAIGDSRLLEQVDELAPPWLKTLPRHLAGVVNTSGLPEVFEPFHHDSHMTSLPDAELAADPIVEKTESSVLRIRGVATSCHKILEGTGFVVASGHVMTNAHVVAGADSVTVESGTDSFPATVISFDPQEDIAVLSVPNLPAKPLQFVTTPASNNSDAVVLGYPGGGVFEATPVRIRDIIHLEGPNIYHSATVNRQVYSVRGNIQQGNSGGPMIDLRGRVLQVGIGAANDDDDTGFVMTAQEVADQLHTGSDDQSVSTQECVSWSEAENS